MVAIALFTLVILCGAIGLKLVLVQLGRRGDAGVLADLDLRPCTGASAIRPAGFTGLAPTSQNQPTTISRYLLCCRHRRELPFPL